MDRRPLRMSVMRPDGTPRSSDSRLALRPRATSSRFRRRPGWATGASDLTLVVVDDLDVIRVTPSKLEANPPTSVHRHCPLISSLDFELVQAHAFQRTEIAQCGRRVE